MTDDQRDDPHRSADRAGSGPDPLITTLDDLEWGDVLSDADGVVEVEAFIEDDEVRVRRYRDEASRAIIEAVRMLDDRGERPADVLGYGDDWIIFAAPDPFEDENPFAAPDPFGDPDPSIAPDPFAPLDMLPSTDPFADPFDADEP